MKKAFLSLLLILATGFIINNKCYSENRYTNTVHSNNRDNMIRSSAMGKYRFLGKLKQAPYTQGFTNVYTDGDYYYCSIFTPSEVECRNDNELRESKIFNKIYKDYKGCYSYDYYGDQFYLYNPETNEIVQDVIREVWYEDWMD